jgi:hypothetical protein
MSMHTSGRIHFLELDLIDRTQTFMKMRRRIHVSTPLTDMSEKFRKKSVTHHAGLLFVPVNRLALFAGKTRPPPEFPTRSRTLDRQTFWLARTFYRSMREVSEAGSTRAIGPDQIALFKMTTAKSLRLSEVFTQMLLTDCAKRSEQLPTTHNNRHSVFPDRQILGSRALLFTSI